MNIEHFLKNTLPSWIKATGEHADIVLSTRIRLARNLTGFRFPVSFSEEDAKQIDESVLRALLAIRDEGPKFSYFPMKEPASGRGKECVKQMRAISGSFRLRM